MGRDPRLANETLLRLAAYRLTHGPRPVPRSWGETQGLAALLHEAARLPPRDPDVPALEATDTGMGRLLREARQWQQEPGHGA